MEFTLGIHYKQKSFIKISAFVEMLQTLCYYLLVYLCCSVCFAFEYNQKYYGNNAVFVEIMIWFVLLFTIW